VKRAAVAWIFLVVALVVGVAFLASRSNTKTLSQAETESLLLELPYRFRFHDVPSPDGASGAVAGRAIGPHHTVVRFGVSLGKEGAALSIGPHSDLADATGGESFRVTNGSTLDVGGRIKAAPWLRTRAQWLESVTMIVAIEEKLCRATEGKPCAI
jgi:hypothetical protein